MKSSGFAPANEAKMPFKTIEFISEEGDKMKKVKKMFVYASLSLVVGIVLLTSLSAQENPAPPEPTKIETPATSSAAPGVEAKKEDPGATPAQFTQGLLEQIGGAKVAIDTMWVLIAGMLVFFMNLGFASV